MNQIAYQFNIICALICAILSLVFVLEIGHWSWIPTTVAGVIFLINTANKNPLLHSLILFYTIIVTICFETILFGLEIDVHRSFLTIIILPFLLFPGEQKTLRISSIFALGIPFFMTVFFPHLFTPIVQLNSVLIDIVSGLFSAVNFLVFLYIISSFAFEKNTREKNLKEQINTITEQKNTIEKAQQDYIFANKELERLYHKIQKQTLLLKETQKLSKIGLWSLNTENNTVSFSEEARTMFQIKSVENITLKEWLDHFSTVGKGILKHSIFSLKTQFTPFEYELTYHIDQTERHIKIIGKAEIHNGKIMRIYGVVQDITQLYENEKLRSAKKDAENLANEKALFLAKMSHEIRTPINGVIGITNLMLKTELSEKQRKYAQSIETSSDTLLMIVNDILDISKIEAGKMSFEKKDFDIKALVHSVYDMFLNKVAERSINLVYHIQEGIKNKLIGDPTRLNQILYNLIGNAIKFTSQGKIEILVSGNENQNGFYAIKIIIKDSGIGIEKDKLEHIFESFTQAESDTTRKYGGTGLGLSIVKQLVALQKGSISVRSEIGKGSEFEVIIPYGIQSEENRSSSNSKEIINVNKHLIKGVKILLVEDNPINQMVVKDMLESQGAIIQIAHNGQEAVDAIKANHSFELVLMDMQMPVMDGYKATGVIREELLIPRTQLPIIALTAHAMEGEMKKCLDSGANDYISKPFMPHELYKKILVLTHRI